MSDEDIELAAEWLGKPESLVRSLVEVRFMDGNAGSRSIHDWATHQPWVSSRGARIEKAKAAAAKRWGTPKGGDAPSTQSDAPSIAPSTHNDARSNAPNPTQPNTTNTEVKTPCDTSAKNADAPRGDGTGISEVSAPEPADPNVIIKTTPPTKKKATKQSDPRYTPTQTFLATAFREVCSKTEPPPWDGHCAKELTNWLASHDLELPAIEALIRNVAKSERADRLLRRPQHLIPDLRQYNVPRDRFGDGPQSSDGRKSSASVGAHQPTAPEPAVEWAVPEAVDLEAGTKLWERAKEQIRPRVSRNSFDTWLKPTSSLGLGKDALYVRLPVEDYASDMGRFDELLREVLPDRPIRFVVPTEVSHA